MMKLRYMAKSTYTHSHLQNDRQYNTYIFGFVESVATSIWLARVNDPFLFYDGVSDTICYRLCPLIGFTGVRCVLIPNPTRLYKRFKCLYVVSILF